LPLDDLELPLDAPGARLYDVISAEQFRHVPTDVIRRISQVENREAPRHRLDE
jgi:hypothetical protein